MKTTTTLNATALTKRTGLKHSIGKGVSDSFGLLSDVVGFARTAVRAEHLDYKLDVLNDIAQRYSVSLEEAKVMLDSDI